MSLECNSLTTISNWSHITCTFLSKLNAYTVCEFQNGKLTFNFPTPKIRFWTKAPNQFVVAN